MAPFSRGGVMRGRVGKRHAQRGRSKPHMQRSRNDGFAISRLANADEQDVQKPSTGQADSQLNDNAAEVSSDEESIHADTQNANPYNALLQSLTTNSAQGPSRERKAEDTTSQKLRSKVNGDSIQIQSNVENESSEADLAEPKSEDEKESLYSQDIESDCWFKSPFVQQILIDAANDAFDEHFCRLDPTILSEHIGTVQAGAVSLSTSTLEGRWKVVSVDSSNSRRQSKPRLPKKLSSSALGIKQKLQIKGEPVIQRVGGVESYFVELLFDYVDILFSVRERSNATNLLRMSCLHALNHIIKTRDRVLKNNEKAAQSKDAQDDRFCDQGFTRPKVLFILPTRQSCYRAASEMVSLYDAEQQENRKRFQDAFKGQNEAMSESKPEDFRDLFAGNDDDMFRVGLKFTRKTARFFAPFYSSDVIFASPLGLRMAIGDEDAKKKEYDFLSSIELVIVDQADAMLMQNWEHVEYIFEHLNLQPREAHGCDFGRVRPWYLDGNAQYVRQTVVLTAFNTPEINSLFNLKMKNFDGKVKVGEAVQKGLIAAPNALFKQIFYRFEAAQPSSEPDARFKYFTSKLVPQLVKRARNEPGQAHGVLIFVNSYMDFVRVRNFFANSTTTRDVPFASLSEYVPAPEVARARTHFMNGKHSVLLYSSRIHHFRRYQLKGTKQVIFYSLPDNPLFWKEIAAEFPARSVAAGKADAAEVTVQALFSKWDALRLERIVGTERLRNMLTETMGDIFEFIP